jgi:hypothetical protein
MTYRPHWLEMSPKIMEIDADKNVIESFRH